MMLRTAILRAALMAGAALFSLSADAGPVYGPDRFDHLTTATDTYTDTITAPAAGTYYIAAYSGDDSGGQVTGGSVVIGGTTVISDADFAVRRAMMFRAVKLLAGANALTVNLAGDPGSFLTLLIYARYTDIDGVHGRVLLPWANVGNLVLDLKNGAGSHDRTVRLLFYDASGAPVASSNKIVLAPRASLSQTASSLIANGSWTEGSIEILYHGRGHGRVFGQASITDATTGVASVVILPHAGYRRLGPEQ